MNNMLTIYVESVIHINFFFIIHGKIGGGKKGYGIIIVDCIKYVVV